MKPVTSSNARDRCRLLAGAIRSRAGRSTSHPAIRLGGRSRRRAPGLGHAANVLDGVLTLAPGEPVLNANSGVAAWARVVNGNGETAFDCDVTDTAGSGEIKIQSTVLYEGGETRMVSGVLTG